MTYTQAKSILRTMGRRDLEVLLDRYGEDVVEAAVEVDVNPENIQECYQGWFRDDRAFAYQLLEGLYDLHGIENIVQINWEGTARDVMMDYTESDGHYFRVM